jgi:hypothetical protein
MTLLARRSSVGSTVGCAQQTDAPPVAADALLAPTRAAERRGTP